MPATFSQMKSALDRIATSIAAARAQLQAQKQSITAVEADLTQLGADNGPIITDINAFAAANPTDAAAQNAKAEAALLVAEFNAVKTVATAAKNAITV